MTHNLLLRAAIETFEESGLHVSKPSDFGRTGTNMDLANLLGRLSKRSWTIYQNSKTVYAPFLGGTTEIVSCSQDWVEGYQYLTAW